MLIAAATAALVFVVGRALLPIPQGSPEPSVPSSAALVSAVDAIDGPQLDGAGLDGSSLDVGAEAGAVIAADRMAPAAKAPSSTDDDAARAALEAPQADKDIARAAWRANWPDVRGVGARASIIIPIKGSAAGASYRFFPKTRAVAIVLPRAASLNTMHYYRLGRAGFQALWTFQDENNALPEAGTKLRIKLAVAAVPQVEIFDDFVKVSIRTPQESD